MKEESSRNFRYIWSSPDHASVVKLLQMLQISAGKRGTKYVKSSSLPLVSKPIEEKSVHCYGLWFDMLYDLLCY